MSHAEPARLVSAPWLLPMDTAALREGAVVLDGQHTVLDVGPRAALRARHPGLAEERARGALLPALVNAHTHLELSYHAPPVPGGDGLVAWVGRGFERARPDAPTVEAAALGAGRALVARGVAAVGDVGNTVDAVPALAAAGLTGVFFHELVGTREARTGDALADGERERAALARRQPWPAGLACVPAPHAPYSCGPDLLRRIFAAAAAQGTPTSIHVAEDPDELALLADGGGRWPAVLARLGVPDGSRTPGQRPLAYLAALGAFAGPVPPLLVHLVHADADDRARARAAGATAVLCPRSNLHIGGRLPDAPALLADGVSIAIGTDSLASVPDLDPWAELAVLAAAFPDVPAARWLEAATVGGAHALRLPALGAIAPGKRPGLIDLPVDVTDAPAEALLRALVHVPPRAVHWIAPAAAAPFDA
jgi:cytosine/adenosine deaminase-related metal-dependent hydrolase